MNIKQKVIDLQKQYTGEEIEVEDVALTIITRYQLFEPCQYMGEDDEWVDVVMTSMENENFSQPMTIRKSEIVMFAIFNQQEIEIVLPQTNPEDFYQ